MLKVVLIAAIIGLAGGGAAGGVQYWLERDAAEQPAQAALPLPTLAPDEPEEEAVAEEAEEEEGTGEGIVIPRDQAPPGFDIPEDFEGGTITTPGGFEIEIDVDDEGNFVIEGLPNFGPPGGEGGGRGNFGGGNFGQGRQRGPTIVITAVVETQVIER